MKRILAAAATATLIAGGAIAQTAATEGDAAAPGWTMEQGTWGQNIAHMQNTVDAELARMGIDANTEDLTIRQLNELAVMLDDDSLSEQERIDQARLLLQQN